MSCKGTGFSSKTLRYASVPVSNAEKAVTKKNTERKRNDADADAEPSPKKKKEKPRKRKRKDADGDTEQGKAASKALKRKTKAPRVAGWDWAVFRV